MNWLRFIIALGHGFVLIAGVKKVPFNVRVIVLRYALSLIVVHEEYYSPKKVKVNNILIYLVNSIMWFYSCLASLTRCKLAVCLIKQGSKKKSVVSDRTHFSHETETTERITGNKKSFQISIST